MVPQISRSRSKLTSTGPMPAARRKHHNLLAVCHFSFHADSGLVQFIGNGVHFQKMEAATTPKNSTNLADYYYPRGGAVAMNGGGKIEFQG